MPVTWSVIVYPVAVAQVKAVVAVEMGAMRVGWPGTGEPGGLPSMGSHRVGYD